MPVVLRWLLRLGPTNPIVVRLVQGGSRRTRHLYIRTGYLAALIAVLLWSLLLGAGQGNLSYRELAAAGAQAFEYVAYLQIGLICILAPVFMAGAIAQEASPRTWDILLTTPLSPAQIVLGNLLGRLFFVAALLFSSLPLFAITQYFGGVPGRSIFASYAIAVCAALLVGAIAISLSVSRLAGKRAFFAFYVAVVSYLAATWSIDLSLRPIYNGVTPLTATNPFLALEAMLNPTAYPRPAPDVLGTMGWLERLWLGSPGLSWCLASSLVSLALIGAGALAVRFIGATEIRGPRALLRRGKTGPDGERHRGPRTVWHNPIAWGEAAARAGSLPKRLARWSFLALGALWGLGMVAAFHGGMTPARFQFALLATVWAELAVITLVAINLAATAVSREREDGTLDLLLTTPITASAYIRGKLRGLVTFLAPLLAVPLGTLAIAGLYVALGGFGRTGGVDVTTLASTARVTVPVVLPEAGLVLPLVVIPFIAFTVIVGVQWSIRSKGTISSVVGAVGIVGVVAGVVTLCGWQMGPSVEFVGPLTGAMSPASLLFSLVDPASGAGKTVAGQSLGAARIALAIGALTAGGVYCAVVYAMHSSMVRRFDMTVRQLAGAK